MEGVLFEGVLEVNEGILEEVLEVIECIFTNCPGSKACSHGGSYRNIICDFYFL